MAYTIILPSKPDNTVYVKCVYGAYGNLLNRITIEYTNGEKITVYGQTAKAIYHQTAGWYSYFPHNSNLVIYTPNKAIKG